MPREKGAIKHRAPYGIWSRHWGQASQHFSRRKLPDRLGGMSVSSFKALYLNLILCRTQLRLSGCVCEVVINGKEQLP